MELKVASSDLNAFDRVLTETVAEIIQRWREANVRPAGDESDPETLWGAFQQLLHALEQYDKPDRQGAADRSRGAEVGELGDYGLNMLLDLERIAAGLGLKEACGNLERLSVNLGLWIARGGGDLSTLELIVNGLAKSANRLRVQEDLEQLFSLMEEIMEAVDPALGQQAAPGPGDPGRSPWILLLMNRAIVATRAHSPRLMENAFSDILEQVPETAPGFFKEAVGQIEPRGYPPPVAEVITRFHQLAAVPKTLH